MLRRIAAATALGFFERWYNSRVSTNLVKGWPVMSNRTRCAIFFSVWVLIGCLSAHAQLPPEIADRPPHGDSHGALGRVLERASGAAALQSPVPSSNAGCSAADAAAEPCPMRILLHGPVSRREWLTGLGTINSQGLSAITDVPLRFGTTELSHNGEFVAYGSCTGPNWAIYVFNVETSETRKVIPIDRGAFCPEVRWSLDDRKLSYVSSVDYGLNVVSVDGSHHVRLPTTGFVDWGSWSPGGEEIVYDNGRGGLRILRIIDLRGNVRQLTRFGDIEDCETYAPDWSPDGTRISFMACGGLYARSPQGANLQELAPYGYSPRWSVDGQWIFFLSRDTLMRVRRDGKFLSKVAEIPRPYWGAEPFSLGMAR